MSSTRRNPEVEARHRYRSAVIGFALAHRILPTYARRLSRQQVIYRDDPAFDHVEKAVLKAGFKYEA